jgi:hypothetical protein
MKEQAAIIILLALCAGFESTFQVTWQKEIVLGVAFMLGMWQDRLSYKRDENLIKNIKDLVKTVK